MHISGSYMIKHSTANKLLWQLATCGGNKGLSGCCTEEQTTKTSCNKTCKYSNNPNNPQGNNTEAQTMETDQRKPTIMVGESRAKWGSV
jgi:hypothetical protein